jgi:prophage antirepressor-like protein
MNAITPFVFEDNLVRTISREGLPWFIGKDVCRALDIGNTSQAMERLDPDEKGITTNDTLGGEQTVIIVSEAGVYRLIFTSRKPSAERFKRWLAHEVLPALRKTGRFAMEGALQHEANPYDITSEAIPVLQTKLAMVREARHLFGHERARQLWSQLKLAEVAINSHSGKGEALDLLQYILDGKFMAYTLRSYLDPALEGDRASNDHLKQCGLWAEPARDGFLIANQHPFLEQLLKGTDWADGKWQWVLRRLPGAVPVKPRSWGGKVNSRGLFLPCSVLDFGEHDIGKNFEVVN